MNAYVLLNGNMVVPIRVESEGVIGDILVVRAPSHPDYEKWRNFVKPAPAEIEQEFSDKEPFEDDHAK
jgi:hypothetical protein